jgi:hypothetical protein
MGPLAVGARRAGTAVRRTYAAATARSRVLPDFLILGAQKGGTTSLHDYLGQHPAIEPPFKKELHHFTLEADRSLDHYRRSFPTARRAGRVRSLTGTAMMTGEATPYYLFHPGVPRQVAEALPEARLIVLLRDPVERAYSHHNHEVALGFEHLGFDAEPERLAGEEQRLREQPSYVSHAHQHFSYVARGLYADQLERWLELFPRERMLVLFSDQLLASPAETTVIAQRFLGLPEVFPAGLRSRNVRTYRAMDPAARRRLAEQFEEPDRRLAGLLGTDLPWR